MRGVDMDVRLRVVRTAAGAVVMVSLRAGGSLLLGARGATERQLCQPQDEHRQ
jgi:hypothetical protein